MPQTTDFYRQLMGINVIYLYKMLIASAKIQIKSKKITYFAP
jgi:replication initiation and membrane attachment protein DnaB